MLSAYPVAPGLFCTVHRLVSIMDQLVRIQFIFVMRNPNAGREAKVAVIDVHCLAHTINDFGRNHFRVGGAFQFFQNDGELVPLQACNGIGRADRRAYSFKMPSPTLCP